MMSKDKTHAHGLTPLQLAFVGALRQVFQTERNPDIDHLVVWVYFWFLYPDWLWVWCGFLRSLTGWRHSPLLLSGRSHRCLGPFMPGSAATSATSLRRRRPLNFNRMPLHDRDIRVPGLLPTIVTRIPRPPYPAARCLLPHGLMTWVRRDQPSRTKSPWVEVQPSNHSKMMLLQRNVVETCEWLSNYLWNLSVTNLGICVWWHNFSSKSN